MSELNLDIEALVSQVLKSLLIEQAGSEQQQQEQVQEQVGKAAACNKAAAPSGVTVRDYPLGQKAPGRIKTPTGKTLAEITLAKVLEGKVAAEDVRITGETLNLQAQIAEQVNRTQFAQNLRRAAELTAIPDQRILEIYNSLRPYRSTKTELLAIADELENQYQAGINAAMVRQAAEVYEKRNRLRK